MKKLAEKPKWYKITGPNGEPINGGSGTWLLPKGKGAGRWMPKVEFVSACSSGYHLVRAVGIIEWLPRAPQTGVLWEAEGRGASDAEGTKTAFAQARLVKKIGILDEVSMRLAAADIAERAIPFFCKVRPKDDRPAKAIQAARDFALGRIDDAARDAAGDAAQAAAQAADQAAAWDAAWDAAWAAAGAAARDAAGDAARDAAWDAAWDAAKAAAVDAAGAAAVDAAVAAAGAAARAAAGDANAKIIIRCARQRLRTV